jgi:hypothetical protein
MLESRTGLDIQMEDTYTLVRRENALIRSSNENKPVTQYQCIMKNIIANWFIQILEVIEGELGGMDALILDARGRILKYE